MKDALHVTMESLDGREVYTLRPKHAAPSGRHVFYLHGGAYIRPITKQHWQFLEHLVRATACTVTVPMYPLAPESSGTSAVDFVQKIFHRTAAGADRELTLMGDSAGGGLALALALTLRDSGGPLPNKVILMSPFVDASLSNPAIGATERCDPMIARAGVQEAARLYAGELPVGHPLISPVNAQLAGLPPMVVFAGTNDITHHDTVRFAEKAQSQGCQVDLGLESKMIHVWPLLPFPEGKRTRNEICGLL